MSPEPSNSLTRAVDEAEPTAGRGSAPILLIAVFALLVFLGMVYLDGHAGGFDSQVYRPYDSWQDVKIHQVKNPGDEQYERGKIVFNQTCSACHQADGKGSAALHVPPLAGSDWVLTEGPNRVIRIGLNGLAGPVTVSGQSFGEAQMPVFKTALSDEQVADVLTYVRKSWGNKAGAVTAAQVKAIRGKVASKDDNWTAPDLLKVPDKD